LLLLLFSEILTHIMALAALIVFHSLPFTLGMEASTPFTFPHAQGCQSSVRTGSFAMADRLFVSGSHAAAFDAYYHAMYCPVNGDYTIDGTFIESPTLPLMADALLQLPKVTILALRNCSSVLFMRMRPQLTPSFSLDASHSYVVIGLRLAFFGGMPL
jgi:hypothetical protein